MKKHLSKLEEDYKTILIHSILLDGLHVTRDGRVDLSRYDKPVRAPEFVKKAIHGTTLNINEAVRNFLEEVEARPNHKCRTATERIMNSHRKQLQQEVETYFRKKIGPSDENPLIPFSILHEIMEFLQDPIGKLNFNFTITRDASLLSMPPPSGSTGFTPKL